MTQIVSSISGIEIWAPSAGYAPLDSAAASAIASGYQVVSSTATQLYAGTAYLTSVNDAPVSASRAGQAANASLANSAYYDGTGRLISALPDEATVSSIASSYAESAVSGKQDESAMSSYLPYSAISADENSAITSINGSSVGESVDLGIWKGMPYTPISGESGFSSVNGYRPVAKFFVNDAVWADNGTGGSYTEMHMNPTASPFLLTTGIYGPLSYATGGVLAYGSYFDTATQVFGGFLKGNEWYISNATAGKALRGEAHASRGVHISGVYTGGMAFDVGTFGLKISSDPTATAKFGVDEYNYWNAKLDSSASSSFYGADNPSGFITGVDLSNYATTSYVDSSVSGKLDTTAQVVSSTAGDGTYITAINGMGISGQGGGGGATGDYVEKSSYQHSLGTANTVTGTSTGSMYLINGTGISADLGGSYVQLVNGTRNTAKQNAFINGYGNFASGGGSILGINSNVTGMGLAVGSQNTINGAALTVGNKNTAYGNSMCIGSYNSASALGYAFGSGLKIKNYAVALGVYNSANDGTNVALVIGDGYTYNDGTWHTANHDLMVVTKDGEITMYSSTADTTGTGIMSAIRAISAAATGGGGGIDSATCSAIASSYAESAASSRMYSSAMQVVANSSQATATGVLYILTGGV